MTLRTWASRVRAQRSNTSTKGPSEIGFLSCVTAIHPLWLTAEGVKHSFGPPSRPGICLFSVFCHKHPAALCYIPGNGTFCFCYILIYIEHVACLSGPTNHWLSSQSMVCVQPISQTNTSPLVTMAVWKSLSYKVNKMHSGNCWACRLTR